MDMGPFRGSRPTERRGVPSRAQLAAHQADEPQPEPETPRTHHASPSHTPNKKDKNRKRFILPGSIAAIILLAAAGWLVWRVLPSLNSGVNSNEYQAVFLSNGQVYFGKLHVFNGGYMKLNDVYYLQIKNSDGKSTDSKNPQDATSDSSAQLIKLGSEIHGPEDEMFIAKDQVLFYENLKPSGKVSQTIKQSKSGNNY